MNAQINVFEQYVFVCSYTRRQFQFKKNIFFTSIQNLLQVCERIPTIGTQLKILSTVKATMLGAQGKLAYA